MIKAIIFDWHGVLEKRTFRGLLQTVVKGVFWKMLSSGRSTEVVHKDIKEKFYDLATQYTAGLVDPDFFWKKLSDDLGEEIVVKAKNYVLTIEKNEELWGMLPGLKEQYRLAILSDCPLDKTNVIRKEMDLSFFEETAFSCEQKMVKKQAEFFQFILGRLGLPASECLFVDDTERHVKFAKSLGFEAHLFKKTSGLKKVVY